MGGALLLGACSTATTSTTPGDGGAIGIGDPADPAGVNGGANGPDTAGLNGGSDPAPATTAPPPTAPETTVPPRATTTTVPGPEIFNEECVVEIGPADSLTSLVERFDDGETINRITLRAENGLVSEDLQPGQLLDVCPGNGLDDVTGAERVDADEEVVAAAVKTNVEAQQLKLNQLFDGYETRELLVDGISGPVTRQRLCAARLALGLDPEATDMEAGSEEERILMTASELPVPEAAPTDQNRWVLIDQTCQILFAGAGEELAFVFPTSTGQEGHQTRSQTRSRAFRYDPASDNGGWHDSTDFPVSIDNPLNGNMYKPIYFDGGQAIHGANNVPTSPQSKGCARLSVAHQELLVDWLDLEFNTAPTWSRSEIGLTVNIQGRYQY